ncbi:MULTISPECIES: hypothetical protein [Stenotrophomonas]|uniref:hypothetical protein n=2 Tax=Stenotrophomonas TaxID=40323 RepID=UPI000C15FE98
MSGQASMEFKFLGRFQDAYSKYTHAQTHLATLVGLFNELHQESWWRPEKVDEEPRGKVRIELLREPTIDWSLVVGDLVHNLRGCLDYATCGMIEVADPRADLKDIQFPFGRFGQSLNSKERRRICGLGGQAIARIEEIRAAYGTDLHLLMRMSNQDKHRLLLPVAVRQMPMKIAIDAATNTGAIVEDIDGAPGVWATEIKNGDEISMPTVLKLDIGLILEDGPEAFPLRDIVRVNRSVGDAFMLMCTTERALLTG